jgi:hypothetical protein
MCLHCSIGSSSNRPQVKSAPVKSAPSPFGPMLYKIKWKYRYLTLFFLSIATCLLEKQIYQFLVFGLTYHIVLKNDTLFVPSGQSPRSECHSFKLIRGS